MQFQFKNFPEENFLSVLPLVLLPPSSFPQTSISTSIKGKKGKKKKKKIDNKKEPDFPEHPNPSNPKKFPFEPSQSRHPNIETHIDIVIQIWSAGQGLYFTGWLVF